MNYGWLLSAITLLLSDVFIYQSKGSIDSHATERLDVILKIADQLRGTTNQREGAKGAEDGHGMNWKLYSIIICLWTWRTGTV
jgi:hypothetical protein